MDVFFKTRAIIIFLSGAVSFCWAIDEEPSSMFFGDRETALRQEYLECTGDPLPVDLKFVIGWKQRMDAWRKTPEYAELLRDYQKTVGASASIRSCALIEWNERRKRVQDSMERILTARVLDSNEAQDVAEEIKALPASRFDFAGIPFGVSKGAFLHLFKMKYTVPIQEKDAFYFAENVPWNGAPFLTAFYFDDDNRLFKYEAESDALPADSVNRAVRPAARRLATALEQSLGPPARQYRIGFYEIKSRELAVEEKWETAGYTAMVGLSVFNYQYYAKAVVAAIQRTKKTPATSSR
jgi:hypothetical protein